MKKRDWLAKPKVLTLENNNLIKIRVNQDIVYREDGCWERKHYFGIKHQRWSRLSEQIFRIDKWSLCRGQAAKRSGSGVK